MSKRLLELDFQQTPMGELTLRRRLEPVTGLEVYEVKLGEEFLMSSLFTVAEIELTRLGLAAHRGQALDVVVGGLGLGYTALTALEDNRVRTLRVIDALPEVIGWHRQGLLPHSAALSTDPRCELVHGDFFALAADGGLGPVDAVLLDVDHTPHHVLHPSHAPFYAPAGLARLADQLRPGGVFALWSDDPPDEPFVADLRSVFAAVEAHDVVFDNPLTSSTSRNTVYVARR